MLDLALAQITATQGVVLVGAILAAVACYLLIPRRRRIETLLVFTPVWMFAFMATQFPTLALAARLTGPAVIALLGWECARAPGPRQRLPFVAWTYPIVAIAAAAAVATAVDARIAILFRLHWIIVIAAAWQIARFCSSQERLEWVAQRFAWSAAIILVSFLGVLLIDPQHALHPFQGRFEPFGTGANSTGSAILFAAPLFGWQALVARRKWQATLWTVGLAAATGMAALTASRTAALAGLLALLPLAVAGIRRLTQKRAFQIRALTGVAGVLLIAVGAMWVIALSPRLRLDRFQSLETSRYEIYDHYLDVFSQRPLTGLLFTDGQRAMAEEELGKHAHNVYLVWAYLVGLPLAGSMVILAGCSLLRAWRIRGSTLGLAIAGIVLAGWIAGIATIQVHHGGAPLSLIHTTFALWMLSRAPRAVGQVPPGRARLHAPAPTPATLKRPEPVGTMRME